MKIRIFLITLLCNVGFMMSQNEIEKFQIEKGVFHSSNEFKDYWNRVSFRLGGGVLIPQKGLDEFFGISPLVELSVDFPLKKQRSIDFSIQFAVPNQKEAFAYLGKSDTINAKATLMFNAMLKFKRNLFRTKKATLNFGVGIGVSSLSTDARNPDYSKGNEEKKYESITSLLVSPGIELRKRFKNNNEFTLSFNVQYSPYKVEGALQENIGSIFFIPKLLYHF